MLRSAQPFKNRVFPEKSELAFQKISSGAARRLGDSDLSLSDALPHV